MIMTILIRTVLMDDSNDISSNDDTESQTIKYKLQYNDIKGEKTGWFGSCDNKRLAT